MSLTKRYIDEVEAYFSIVKKIMEEEKIIIVCECGDYYWIGKNASDAYKIVFNKIKEIIKSNLDTKLVQSTIKDILDYADISNSTCPHCEMPKRTE